MSDLISRQVAVDAIQQHREDVLGGYEYDEGVAFVYAAAHNHIIDVIKHLPSTQPERKTGKWINAYPDIEPNPMFMYGICSECGFEQSISDKLNYCPNCGADMRGEQNETD